MYLALLFFRVSVGLSGSTYTHALRILFLYCKMMTMMTMLV